MVEELCPVCGCTIVEVGYEKEGVINTAVSPALPAAGLASVAAAILSKRTNSNAGLDTVSPSRSLCLIV